MTATEWSRLVYDHPPCDCCPRPADWIRLAPDGVIERLCDGCMEGITDAASR